MDHTDQIDVKNKVSIIESTTTLKIILCTKYNICDYLYICIYTYMSTSIILL